jgi:hypothetical protein
MCRWWCHLLAPNQAFWPAKDLLSNFALTKLTNNTRVALDKCTIQNFVQVEYRKWLSIQLACATSCFALRLWILCCLQVHIDEIVLVRRQGLHSKQRCSNFSKQRLQEIVQYEKQITIHSSSTNKVVVPLNSMSACEECIYNSQQQKLCTRVNSAYSCKSKVLEMGEGITLAMSRVPPLPTALHNWPNLCRLEEAGGLT